MKKILLLAAVAVMGVSVSAQEFRFGPKAGYSFSNVKLKDNSNSETSDPVHTFYVGGLAEYKISDRFGLQGEVLYSPLGGKLNVAEVDPDDPTNFLNIKAKQTYHTLLVPISAKYFITEGLSVSAGASFGVILSAKQKYSADLGLGGVIPGFELNSEDEMDIKDQMNTLNIAPFLGAEYMLENGLFFDARYNLGVSNLAKNTSDGEKMTNSFFQVGVGFKFGGN
ncbi:Outer membrane protein beta-barrel domain-containing protein [Chryseobacterium arachidis]|uniref:Outer membrane protein beta-barrel domain-containing protein n=1 Tax=Chryseobacterium arachidis TaxID=1416778 RepID=A0A1M5BDS8_9FLAO|nr:porin family protein [Chryseobacterium arachidis]SHF40560.1 Outer membrane protein beta-barrel domain-containing protein [Chryseobacterium arachidis]